MFVIYKVNIMKKIDGFFLEVIIVVYVCRLYWCYVMVYGVERFIEVKFIEV